MGFVLISKFLYFFVFRIRFFVLGFISISKFLYFGSLVFIIDERRNVQNERIYMNRFYLDLLVKFALIS